jgi:hypothetical protein
MTTRRSARGWLPVRPLRLSRRPAVCEEQGRGRGEVRCQRRDGLETKFPQKIQAQRKAGNLMLSVGPEGHDCLFNAIGRHGGAAEKRAESFFGRDSEVAVACRAEHDIVSRHPDASDP